MMMISTPNFKGPHLSVWGTKKGRPSLSGPDRWLDSADPYIRSALLSEVVSANIETIVHPTRLINPEHRIQPSDT
jgi:hypothetical protein